MKVIVLLGGFGSRMRPHTWSRPKPLLKVAGNTVLGHILDLMSDIITDEVIFVVGYLGEQIEQWVRQSYPGLKATFVTQERALGQAHAVWLCRDHLRHDEPMVVAFGDGVVEADFAAMAANPCQADAVFLVKEVEDPRKFGVAVLNPQGYITGFVEKPKTMEHRLAAAGINWFRSSRQLIAAIETIMSEKRQTLGEYFMADAYQVLLEQGAKIVTQKVVQWSDAGNPENILLTNMRLLSVGYNSPEAIERSYAEDFTVLPPVYLHPMAQVEGSVIGPYASIEAGVKIKGSVVRNSIVDAQATIQDAVLDGALVGEKAFVSGRAKALFVGDDSKVEL